MPNYTNLSTVNSFPTTKMGSVNKLITENSLTRLINRLIDVDGFIITDGLARIQNGQQSETIGNGGKHLIINEDLSADNLNFRDGLFEFILRGYYFSVPFTDLKNIILPDPNNLPSATTCLYARIFIDKTNEDYPELVGQIAEEENGVLPHQEVQFFVSAPNSKPTPEHQVLEVDAETGEIVGLGTNYLYYDLMLLKYVVDDNTMSNGLYVPFSSMNKFDSHSQRVIDGGELTFVD